MPFVHQRSHPLLAPLIIMLLAFSQAAFSATGTVTATATPVNIVVTIKPLYSLVAHVVDGVARAHLLLDQEADPHHLQLRPSQRQLLAQADIVVRVGGDIDNYLDPVIRPDSEILNAMDASGIQLLPLRQRHTHSHDHGGDIDPHVWLSPDNAILISEYVARQFKLQAPEHSEHIDRNLAGLIARIRQADHDIANMLNAVSAETGYIAQHDAYQYFDHYYSLPFVATITIGEESGSSLKHVRELQALISKHNIQCIVYQYPKASLVERLADRYQMQTREADPSGYRISKPEQWKQAWFLIMQSVADSFQQCLPHKSAA
jgi:zinc transport system substrate-binding protein